MSYANQNQLEGLETLAGEITDLLFVESDRKAAYTDIKNETFDSLDRLYILAREGNSHQAKKLISLVTLGEVNLIPVFTETGQLINYDDYWSHLVSAEQSGNIEKSEAIARLMNLPAGCMIGDGK